TYGGLPMAASIKTHEGKAEYLQRLFQEVYLKDILERNRLYHSEEMQELLCVLASSVGSLCSPRKLADTFKSVKQVSLSPNTIATYGRYFENAFLLHRARRYDIKGRHYIDSPFKFYFEDIGLRNALLNFRQMEESHLMENIIYNELRLRGYSVDVGIVPVQAKQPDGKYSRARLEVDFVANQGSKRFYLQSAFRMYDDEKIEQENRPLRHIDDSFKKIVVAGDSGLLWRNNDGHVIMNIQDFLLNPDSLDL
ncbi:MAG: ATP-binding protein, partial [Victivallales bacterium]|nr:ATP-binding protein [Victivallales bacterium]